MAGSVLCWDDYCMAVAHLTAKRSEDPSTKAGACIVNSQEQRLIGTGYNCMLTKLPMSDPWAKNEDWLKSKYPYVCHAAMNAVMNCREKDLKHCSIYATLSPCNECAKLIIQAGIKEVVYLQNKFEGAKEMTAAETLFTTAGVTYRRHVPSVNIPQWDPETTQGEPMDFMDSIMG